jgi:hypothetical protein
MITTKGDVTNMKKRPTFIEKSSMTSWKDLNFDMHCRNPNFSWIKVTTTVVGVMTMTNEDMGKALK